MIFWGSLNWPSSEKVWVVTSGESNNFSKLCDLFANATINLWKIENVEENPKEENECGQLGNKCHLINSSYVKGASRF